MHTLDANMHPNAPSLDAVVILPYVFNQGAVDVPLAVPGRQSHIVQTIPHRTKRWAPPGWSHPCKMQDDRLSDEQTNGCGTAIQISHYFITTLFYYKMISRGKVLIRTPLYYKMVSRWKVFTKMSLLYKRSSTTTLFFMLRTQGPLQNA